MRLFRRLLLVWLLMFWQGGFMFYGAVVVPIGTAVLRSAQEQGWITQRVTDGINLAAVPALVVWAWALAAEPPPTRGRRVRAWLLWLLLVAALVALAWVHVRMDALLDAENRDIIRRPDFRELHRWYLRVSTVQWLGAIVLSVATLRGWRDADRRELPKSAGV
jgi:hypothetical protein